MENKRRIEVYTNIPLKDRLARAGAILLGNKVDDGQYISVTDKGYDLTHAIYRGGDNLRLHVSGRDYQGNVPYDVQDILKVALHSACAIASIKPASIDVKDNARGLNIRELREGTALNLALDIQRHVEFGEKSSSRRAA